jgi:hypothetical protein
MSGGEIEGHKVQLQEDHQKFSRPSLPVRKVAEMTGHELCVFSLGVTVVSLGVVSAFLVSCQIIFILTPNPEECLKLKS